MKQPIQVTVSREHANVGDVVTTLTDARGDVEKHHVPGDCSPYTAITALQPFLERELNAWKEPPDGKPFCVEDIETGEISVLLDGVVLGTVQRPPPPVVVEENTGAQQRDEVAS